MNQKVSLEIWTLIEAVCNETATADQRERVGALVKQDPDVRRLYFEYVDIHLGCAEIVAARSAPALPAHLRPRPRPRMVPMAIAATCAAAAVALLVVWPRSGQRPIATGTDEARQGQAAAPPQVQPSGSEQPPVTTQPAPDPQPLAGSEPAVAGAPAGSGTQATGHASAPKVARSEDLVAILRRAPRALVASLRIDNSERRLAGASCPAEQPGGLMNLFSGSALGDRERIDEGVRMLEDTMPTAKGQWMVGNDACSARWLAWAGVALDAVGSSLFAAEFDDRLQKVRQSIGPAVARVRLRVGGANGIRPLESALAFIALGRHTKDDDLTKQGAAELQQALRSQRPDGRMADRPSCEAHLHAADVLLAHAMLALQPDDDVERAVRVAGEWLVRFMQPGSTGLPDKTGPDACEYKGPRRQLLQWALAMHGIRFDPEALERAQQTSL